ncbi:DMT family transporter [Tundrisphaera sp. TA3]|uniref:DMT family transporter n=1 Tax=Tundrisphaera sp. TA3 TaxID=3435775 RepID=UPI003EBC3FA7
MDRQSGGIDAATRGRLCVLAAAVMWSLSGVLTKGLAMDGAPIAFYRGLFGGLALLPFVPARDRAFRPRMLLMALVFAVMTGLYLAAMKATTAANAIFLQSSAIFWVIPIGYLALRERPDRLSMAGVAVALVGIALIVARGRDGRPGEGVGIALGLASGVAFAAVLVAIRCFRDLDPAWLSAFNNLGGAAFLGLWIVATTGSLPIPSGGQWPTLVLFGVVQMAIPYILFARGLRHVSAAEAGLIGLVEPILNPLWVYLQHGERPADSTMIGGVFLILGVAVGSLPRRRR